MDQAGALRQLRFGHPRRRTQQVRVAVDEARHHHPPGDVDLQRVSRFSARFSTRRVVPTCRTTPSRTNRTLFGIMQRSLS
jgi:hypothetical protein